MKVSIPGLMLIFSRKATVRSMWRTTGSDSEAKKSSTSWIFFSTNVSTTSTNKALFESKFR